MSSSVPSLSELYFEWMRLNGAGEYTQALEISATMIDLCRDGATPTEVGDVCRAISTTNLEYWTECESTFRTAMQEAPRSESPWIFRANALMDLERFDEAMLSLRKALELNPHSAEACWRLGWARAQGEDEGCLEEALGYFDKALELAPDSVSAWFYKGLTLSNAGRNREALACFDKLLDSLNPDNGFAWYCKAITLENLNRLPDAQICYARAEEST